MRTHVIDPKTLKVSGLIQPGPTGPRIPAAAEMRAATERLGMALNEAVTRRAVDPDGPPRHAGLDETLMRIVWLAKPLGVDLKAELRKMEIAPKEYWFVNSVEEGQKRFNDLVGARP